eukprot:scaffold6613_cov158-Skeletonema_marinoi.AAC.8
MVANMFQQQQHHYNSNTPNVQRGVERAMSWKNEVDRRVLGDGLGVLGEGVVGRVNEGGGVVGASEGARNEGVRSTEVNVSGVRLNESRMNEPQSHSSSHPAARMNEPQSTTTSRSPHSRMNEPITSTSSTTSHSSQHSTTRIDMEYSSMNVTKSHALGYRLEAVGAAAMAVEFGLRNGGVEGVGGGDGVGQDSDGNDEGDEHSSHDGNENNNNNNDHHGNYHHEEGVEVTYQQQRSPIQQQSSTASSQDIGGGVSNFRAGVRMKKKTAEGEVPLPRRSSDEKMFKRHYEEGGGGKELKGSMVESRRRTVAAGDMIVEGECKYHNDAVVLGAPLPPSPHRIFTLCCSASGVCRPFLM